MKKEIGKLSFSLEDFFSVGKFGPVYRGKLGGTIQVKVEQIEKSKFLEDRHTLIQHYDNIMQHYTVEEDLQFYYVASERTSCSLEDLITGNHRGPEKPVCNSHAELPFCQKTAFLSGHKSSNESAAGDDDTNYLEALDSATDTSSEEDEGNHTCTSSSLKNRSCYSLTKSREVESSLLETTEENHDKKKTEPLKKNPNRRQAKRQRRHPVKNQISSRSLAVLNKWLHNHHDDPYPNYEQKIALAEEAGLDVIKVNRWFINARKVPRQSQSVTRKRKTLKSANKKDKSSLNDNELEVEPLPSCSKVHNLPTRNGDSPIHVRQEDSSCTDNHLSPLELLIRKNKAKHLLALVKSALQTCKLGNESYSQSGALIELCTHQHNHPDFMAVVRLLIENGADINAVDHQGRNSLHILCMMHLDTDDLFDMAQFLIERGIDYKACDKNGKSTVRVLNERGISKSTSIMRLLLWS